MTTRITKQAIVAVAQTHGLDLVGVANIERFRNAPPRMHPAAIFPECRSVLVVARRILRGNWRGIEEGTQYYQYSTMGVMHIDELFAPATLRRLACFLEDNGYDGAVYRAVTDRPLTIGRMKAFYGNFGIMLRAFTYISELGAEVIPIGVSPNGVNINDQCGSLYPEVVAAKVKDARADIGISLDGDADRVIIVDQKGEIQNGDRIMAICAVEMARRKTLAKNTVVATVMSNIGLELYLKERKIIDLIVFVSSGN